VGLAVARELTRRHPRASVCVLEREHELAAHQSGHSSGVIHAGIYYAPGSPKARLCVQGARELYEYCEAHDISHERCGKVILATSHDELPALDELERRGQANGVPGLRRVGPDELARLEPAARAVAGLHSPATGIVDFGAVARALERELRGLGAVFALGRTITAVRREHGQTVLAHAGGGYQAAWSVLCAGLWSDRLAVSAGASPDPRIVPFRGAYLRLAADGPPVVRGMVYPVPDPAFPFLGVHLTKGVDGTVVAGPNAVLALARERYRRSSFSPRDTASTITYPGFWRFAARHLRTGTAELWRDLSTDAFVRDIQRYVPAVTRADVRFGPSGIRAQALGRDGRLADDFVIEGSERIVHVVNAPSPAATSSLAIAGHIARLAFAALD